MKITIVDGDADDSFTGTLAAITCDLLETPGDALMGLYHYGDMLEVTPLDALGTAVEQEYRTACQHHTRTAALGQALRSAAARSNAMPESDYLWGVAMSMRFRTGTERNVLLTAVGLDGTVYWCEASTEYPPVCSQITNGAASLGTAPVVAGIEAVLDAAVRQRDRQCRSAIAAMIDAIRTGEGRGDGHAAFGIWQHGDDIAARVLLGVTSIIDYHVAGRGDLDAALEQAAADLTAMPSTGEANGLVGVGLVTIVRTGPDPIIIANGAVGTRLHLVTWLLEDEQPFGETCPWHELTPGNQRFINALRAVATALTSPPA